MRLDVVVHWGEPLPREDLAYIKAAIKQLLHEVRAMSANLDRLTTEVTEMRGAVDSAIALINGLADVIRETAPTEEALAALADSLDAQVADLGAAVSANPLPGGEPPVG